MSSPATVTLNVGSPAADVVFTDYKPLSGKAVGYTSPSPNGDLAGELTLTLSSETTKSGIERTSLKIVEPVLNASTGEYDKTRTAYVVLTRDRLDDTDANNVGRILEMISAALGDTDVFDAIVEGRP